ncbi:MAG: sigma-70 family RNA polymerase sigma factor [Rhodocyclales bacterium]|nr:sigma-70 family RNA polymerase sigma factor [Rhodocyclales bacterium]
MSDVSEVEYLNKIATEEERNPATYPELYNLSAAFLYRFMARPLERSRPEFLYLPFLQNAPRSKTILELTGLMGEWNMAWEQGQLRSQTIFYRKEWSRLKRKVPLLKELQNRNVYLLPNTEKRFNAYLPLFSMLPLSLLERYGLPPIRKMVWPTVAPLDWYHVEPFLPDDFQERLSRAFAAHVWPLIDSGSSPRAFSKDEPLRLLAHNLDFWLPHAVRVAEARLSQNYFVELETEKDRQDLAEIQANVPKDEATVDRCRQGGHIWLGEAEAREATSEMVEIADKSDQLKSLIDAIRSNRVEEDFSEVWSYAREDFERKLHRKRSRVRIKFVELSEAENIIGPESEIHERSCWQDFFAILDEKELQLVVCLTKSATNLSEAARLLGYANHAPVSKALARIRKKARDILDN